MVKGVANCHYSDLYSSFHDQLLYFVLSLLFLYMFIPLYRTVYK